ncbi:hypothetical protein [Marivivens aquimaris]|uniref:hypothetical protein n=1 Tax=Marivivens aquimaris TaxID=2774876 RepID=UPI001881FF46|nr:hypothetical protein [Marivivens aquimaris]
MNWNDRFEYLQKFLSNFPLGLAIGALIGATFALILSADISIVAKDYFSASATILITAFSAGIATFGVLLTIAHQDKMRQDEKRDRLRARRAMLSSVVSQILGSADKNCRIIFSTAVARRDGAQADEDFQKYAHCSAEDLDDFPSDEAMSILLDCIGCADEKSANWLTALVTSFWTAWRKSQFDPLPSMASDGENRMLCPASELCRDWLIARNIATHCVRYSLGKDPQIPDYISLSLLTAGIFPERAKSYDLWQEFGLLNHSLTNYMEIRLGLPTDPPRESSTVSVSIEALRNSDIISY